ncbi:RecQ family ATP-dependent DNA helicase [Candidatus Amoebophilus asiaticus]|nr:RecQ family ATP-dependent DNA helicase [Candidatus Amoebophilus asiaticus]
MAPASDKLASLQGVLEKYWGYKSFRPLQEEIIKSVLSGNDTLALLPTGGGKSICYQVPGIINEGICVVISPLIALMKDQVEELQKRNLPAVAVVSGMSKREVDNTLDNCIYGKIKFLYMSPERLGTDMTRERLIKMNINLLAVDEAHCISQWGYDFRPSYLEISEARELLPNVPILALTATATSIVKKDIQDKLLFKNQQVFQKSFVRQNLSYVVLHEENKSARLLKVFQNVKGSGIVYVRNRKETKKVADFLTRHKINADCYHAGLDSKIRSQKQDKWKNDKIRVIVSTNAFGMGIDKPNVKSVVHLDLPESVEAYYQEAGRAGRDGKKAFGVLLFNKADKINFERLLEVSFPSINEIKRTYQALVNYFQLPVSAEDGKYYDFDLTDFSAKFNLRPLIAYNCIKRLEQQNILAATETFHSPSRLTFIIDNNDLYKFQVAHSTFDEFVKLLLRSYEGLFNGYVKINESEIAKRMNIKRKEVIDKLNFLDQSKIINYLPQNDLPKIIFLGPREDVANLIIDKKYLLERRKVYKEKMLAIIDYAERNNKCRSRLLVEYFGEIESKNCGICDVCLKRNKLNIDELEFATISKQVKSTLYNEALNLSVLVNHVKGINEDKTLKAIQWMIDNGTLKISTDNVVKLST